MGPASVPSRSLAPWSGDGGLVASLGLAEDEDELQGSESEPSDHGGIYKPGLGASRLGNRQQQQPPKAILQAADLGASAATKPASTPVRAGIQPALNSFELGTGLDEVSDSEGMLKASQDAPSDGSGSVLTPTQRKNPLAGRGVARGRGAGLQSGLLRGGSSSSLGDDRDVYSPSNGSVTRGRGNSPTNGSVGRGRGNAGLARQFGATSASDYFSPSKAGASALSAMKAKAKTGASKFSMSSALGGERFRTPPCPDRERIRWRLSVWNSPYWYFIKRNCSQSSGSTLGRDATHALPSLL